MSDKANLIRDLVRGVFAAYRANDRQSVEESLTEDFRFTSPFDDSIDKATYFAKCWRDSGWIERQDLERIFVDGDAAFVTYQCVAKDGKSFRKHRILRLCRRPGAQHRRLFRGRIS